MKTHTKSAYPRLARTHIGSANLLWLAASVSFGTPSPALLAEGPKELINGAISPVSPISPDRISILEQPRSQTLKEGQSAIFKVSAFTEKGDLRFQWLKDGSPIEGATSPTLTLQNVSPKDQGIYSVIVQSPTQRVLSEQAKLAVERASTDGDISVDKISILEQPRSQALKEGQSAIFKVSAFTEKGDLRFQWLKDGSPIEGANSPTLTLPNVSLKDQGIYSVIVQSPTQKVLSDSAKLAVEAKPEPSSGTPKPNDKQTSGESNSGKKTSDGTGSGVASGVIPARGTYQGLLARHDSGGAEELPIHSGRITIAVTPRGALSGNLEYGGLSYRFSGKLDSTSRFLKTFALDAQNSLELALHWDAATNAFTASVQGGRFGADEVSDSTLELSDFNAKTRPAPQAGKYTLALHSTLNPEQIRGFASAMVSPTGTVIFVGRSGDGTPISSFANLLSSGEVAFYVSLKGLAQLCGPVAFDKTEGFDLSNGANGGVQGQLELATLPQFTESGELPGSVEALDAEGSVYAEPQAGSRVLELDQPNRALTLSLYDSNAENAEPLLTKQLTLSARNLLKTIGANNDGLNLRFNSKTGAIRGTFSDAEGVKWSLEGVVLQSSGLFEGIWIAKGTSGGWSLSQPAASQP